METTLTVFAAANLTEPLSEIQSLFEKSHPGVRVALNFAGTQILKEQLEQGARADVIVTADREHMEQLQTEGLVNRFQAITQSGEVIVVPKTNPAGIASLQDLAAKPCNLVIGDSHVPIGRYTRSLFRTAARLYGPSFAEDVMRHVVSEETNVKGVLAQVALGQADAGIVYNTDVTPRLADRIRVIPVPASVRVIAENYMGIVTNTAHPGLAREWLEWIAGRTGKQVFEKYGYLPAETVWPAGRNRE